MSWTIYCHTHIESGRRYVGLTSRSMERRWSQHVSQARSTKDGRWHFPNAIRKYGKDAFSHEVLEVCHSLEVANLAEECWIEFFEARNPEKGFNMARGGFHIPHPVKSPWDDPEYRSKQSHNSKMMWERPGFRSKNLPRLLAFVNNPEFRAANRIRLSTPESRERQRIAACEAISRPEVRAKMSAAQTGKKHSAERRQKVSDAVKNRSPELKERIRQKLIGRKHTEEAKRKISAARKGKPLSQKNRDAIAKARRPKITHCKHGHSMDDAYIKPNGDRNCRACHKAYRLKRSLLKEVKP